MPNIPLEANPYGLIRDRLVETEIRLRNNLHREDRLSGSPAPGQRQAAVVALLARKPEWSMLFTLRPDTMRRHAGQVSFPGGRLEEGETALQAAMREMQEEVGVTLPESSVVGVLPVIDTVGSEYRVLPYVALCDQKPAIIADPGEVEEVFWIPLLQFSEEPRHTPCQVTGDRYRTTIDYWDVEGERGKQVVWGATGAMMREFLQLVFEVQLPHGS